MVMSMLDSELMKFVKRFNRLIKSNAAAYNKGEMPTLSAEHVEQLYFSICDLLADIGYSVISKSVYEELFELHSKDADKDNISHEKMLLTFILQFANLGAHNETNIAKYSLNCSDHTAVYDLLYLNRKLEIGNPLSNRFSFIYDPRELLKVFIDSNIIQINDSPGLNSL